MHHIFKELSLEFTIFGLLLHICCFGICLLARIGLDYYTTKNNTFNDIIINNLTKLCNMTCACFFIQTHILQAQPSFYF
jgi:hypothetical protein